MRLNRLLAVMLAGACAFLDTYATQPLLPALERAFGASEAAVSLTVSATTMAVALAAPLIGLFADRTGRKRVIVPAIYALSVPTFLAAHAASLPGLIGWRFAQGLFMPAIFAVTVAYVSEEWAGEGVGRAMSAYVTGTVIGGFLGREVTALTAELWGWRAAFWALGGLNLLGGVAVWAWMPESSRFHRPAQTPDGLRAAAEHLRNPALLATYAVGFCVLFSLVGTFTYVTFYLAGAPFHLGTAELGSIFFVYLLGVVVTPMAGGWIDRVGARRTLAGSLLLAMVGLLLTLGRSLLLVVLGLAVCSSGVFMAQSAANSHVGAAARRARALAVGLYVTCYYLGGAVGGVLPAITWHHGGWPACVALMASVQAGSALFVWRFLRDVRVERPVTVAPAASG